MMFRELALAEVCEMNSGGTPRREFTKYYGGDIKWAKISDIENAEGGYLFQTEETITEEGLRSINNRIFPEKTLLLAMYGSVGKTAITAERMATNQAILGIRPKNGTVDLHYLKYWLDYVKPRLMHRAVGGTLQNISLKIVSELKIPLPPLPIQKKITTILEKADSLRQKDKQLLEHYNKLARSIFYDMFGDPVRNEKGWKFEVVENLLINKKEGTKCGPFGSALKRDEYVEFGIPVWVMDNIDEINFIDRPLLHISDDKYRDLKSYEVKNGDIIVSRAGTVGKMAVVQSEASTSIISTNLIKVALDRNLASPYYFVYLMKFHGEKLGRLKKGRDGAFTHMNTGIIRSLMIPVPDIKTQRKFEHILTSLRTQNDFLEVSRAKSETFFQSLLNKAFKDELVKDR